MKHKVDGPSHPRSGDWNDNAPELQIPREAAEGPPRSEVDKSAEEMRQGEKEGSKDCLGTVLHNPDNRAISPSRSEFSGSTCEVDRTDRVPLALCSRGGNRQERCRNPSEGSGDEEFLDRCDVFGIQGLWDTLDIECELRVSQGAKKDTKKDQGFVDGEKDN